MELLRITEKFKQDTIKWIRNVDIFAQQCIEEQRSKSKRKKKEQKKIRRVEN